MTVGGQNRLVYRDGFSRAHPAARAGQGWSWSTRYDGTIEAVGSDYLEIAEHELGEVRRRVAVRARRFVGFEAVVAVTVPPARR